MRLGLFDVSRRWPRQRTWDNDGTSFREQRNFLLSSVQFVDLILPSNSHAEIWTRLHAPQFLPISGHRNVSLPPSLEWHVWSSSSGNNCHAVHRSLSSGASLCDGTVGFFYLVSYCQPSCIFTLESLIISDRCLFISHSLKTSLLHLEVGLLIH